MKFFRMAQFAKLRRDHHRTAPVDKAPFLVDIDGGTILVERLCAIIRRGNDHIARLVDVAVRLPLLSDDSGTPLGEWLNAVKHLIRQAAPVAAAEMVLIILFTDAENAVPHRLD